MLASEKIYGKIIALLREIKFHEPESIDSLHSIFLISNNSDKCYHFGNIGLEWWYTKESLRICDDISKMIMATNEKLKDGDYKYFSENIRESIQNNCLNKELFNSELLFNSKAKNLLEAKNQTDYKIFARKLYEIIENQLTTIINDWMILYPITIIKSDTYFLESLDIVFLSSKDVNYWNKISADFKSSFGFNPSTGENYTSSIIPAAYKTPSTWLIIKTNGTELGANRRIEILIRKLMVCVYSFITSSYEELNNLIENDTPRYCIMFPKYEENVGFNLKIDSLPYLQPPFSSNVKINIDVLRNVDSYIHLINKLNPRFQKRFETATQFIHYGMMTDSDIERFMNFYIALDALFGEKGQVEESIKNGLLTIKNFDKKIEEKANELFDLRNEIVHGGCSRLKEWKRYENYLDQYGIDPHTDIELICYSSIKNYANYCRNITKQLCATTIDNIVWSYIIGFVNKCKLLLKGLLTKRSN